jgi:hypothetical protein
MSAQVPSGKQTFEVAHCICSVHFWQLWSTHAGVAAMHAPGSLVVHSTHVIEPPTSRSHTPIGALHCSFAVHAPPSC